MPSEFPLVPVVFAVTIIVVFPLALCSATRYSVQADHILIRRFGILTERLPFDDILHTRRMGFFDLIEFSLTSGFPGMRNRFRLTSFRRGVLAVEMKNRRIFLLSPSVRETDALRARSRLFNYLSFASHDKETE